jgi:NTP pyrophosphatase (non-canonical NTP hydrolase)
MIQKTIAELSKEIHENARSKGFWDKERNLGEMLMLIVSEVAEAMEADRNSHFTEVNMLGIAGWVDDKDFRAHFANDVKDTFEDELADACIRIFDLAYSRNIDLQAHIEAKMRYNATRPHMHGKKY